MARELEIIVEKHLDGYVAYPLGLKGVIEGKGDTYEEALADVKSVISFQVEDTEQPENMAAFFDVRAAGYDDHMREALPDTAFTQFYQAVSSPIELTPKSWTLFRRFLVQNRGPEYAPGATVPRIRPG